jgi:hypothetical protein
MLPPSWKDEIKKSVEETTNAEAEDRRAQEGGNAAKIAAAIIALRDAQNTRTEHLEAGDRKKRAIDLITIAVVSLTLIFTGLSWIAFYEQVHEMKLAYGPIKESAEAATKSANVAESTLVATNRPWISVEKIDITAPLEITEDGGFTEAEVHVKNVGKSPAIRVGIATDLLIRNREDTLERQKTFCAAVRSSLEKTAKDTNALKPEFTIFPDRLATLGTRASFRPDDFKKYWEWLRNIPGPAALPTIIGCVHYEFAFAEGYHVTGIIVDMNRKSPAPYVSGPVQVRLTGAVPFPGKTEPGDFSLTRSFAGTGAID